MDFVEQIRINKEMLDNEIPRFERMRAKKRASLPEAAPEPLIPTVWGDPLLRLKKLRENLDNKGRTVYGTKVYKGWIQWAEELFERDNRLNSTDFVVAGEDNRIQE